MTWYWFLLLLLLTPSCYRAGFESQEPSAASEIGRPGAGAPTGPSDQHGESVIIWRDREVIEKSADTHGAVTAWLTLEGQRGGYLQALHIDGRSVHPTGAAIPLPTGRWVRGIGVDPQGRLLIGNGRQLQLLRVDVAREPLVIEELLTLPGPPDIGDFHGICSLPGGNLIGGEYGGSLIIELAVADRALTPLTTVYTTATARYTLSACQATSDDELYLTDYEGVEDSNGDVLHLIREGGQWVERARFDTSAFDLLHSGAENNSAIFSFVVHSNGSLYALPMRRWGDRLKRLIRCPADNIRLEQCTQLGELPVDRSSVINDVDSIQGAAELPGGALLFATNGALYRYLLAEDRYEQLFDLGDLELANDTGRDQLFVTRGLVLR